MHQEGELRQKLPEIQQQRMREKEREQVTSQRRAWQGAMAQS
jgi:hypothetical protein